ncbi:MAG: YraN family protein [Candidatus Saccharimonadales bacterium]
MNTTDVGKRAEAQAAAYLRCNGYQIIGQNWRIRYCEIDIVAIKNQIVYFVEVKYRSRSQQGSGFDYITPAKLHRMEFAAKVWTQHHDWLGDYQLVAVEVQPQKILMQII